MQTAAHQNERTYWAEHGRIVTSLGQVLSVQQARDRRASHLAEIEKTEARYGDTRPDFASAMQAADLSCARQLREAIRQVRAYDCEPSVLDRAA